MNNPANPTTILSYNLQILDYIEFRQIRDSWILPGLLIRKLACHYLLYWDKQYLIDRNGLKDNQIMSHQGKDYISILAAPLTEFNCCARVALSFRHPVGTNYGYVLIKPAIKRYGVDNEH